MTAIETFKIETSCPFDLRFLSTCRTPIEVQDFKFKSFPQERVNHYLIKSNEDINNYRFGDIKSHEIMAFISCITSSVNLDLSNRYCFLTIDQGWVDPTKTLRTPGWHIDGLQGDEVPVKRLADIQFIWCDCLPALFAEQEFDITGLDLSKNNVFNWLGKQVKYVAEKKPNYIYLMNPYHVHSAMPATVKTYRKFLRVSFTQTPVTSVKMTVNPEMKYNYSYHKTSGEVPSHLV